jgi:hypothetical protein
MTARPARPILVGFGGAAIVTCPKLSEDKFHNFEKLININ